jgi:ribose transport system permease protein
MTTTEGVHTKVGDAPRQSDRRRVIRLLGENGFIVIFILWVILLSLTTTSFATADNLFLVLRQAAITGIVAIGAHFIILLGNIDLSSAATLTLSGVVMAALLVNLQLHPIIASLGALAVGALVGLANGLIVTRLKINAIITTLGTSGILAGISLIYTQGKTIYGDPIDNIEFLSRGRLLELLPVPVIILFALYVLSYIILKYTTFGAHVFAVGNNEKAAWLSGIPVDRVKLMAFVLAGTLAGVGGIMQVARQGTATGTMGDDFLFPILTAVVLGGASLSGGRGKIFNTLIAAVFLTTVTNGMIKLGMDIYLQRIVSGVILVVALSLDRLRSARV